MYQWWNKVFDSKRKKRLFYITASLVVFFTTYALVLPAITIDDETAANEPGISIEENNPYEETYDPFLIEQEKEAELSQDTATVSVEETDETLNNINNVSSLDTSEKEDYLLFYDDSTDIIVSVVAPKGAFPEGTMMKVTAISSNSVIDTVNSTLESEKKKEVKAVDITFYDMDGNEIEPSLPIQVSFVSDLIKQDAQIIHIDNDGEGSLVEQSDQDSKSNELIFESKDFSTYIIVVETDVITAEGETYTVTVSYDEDAKLPQNIRLEAEELTGDDYNAYKAAIENELGTQINYLRLFDISIINKDTDEKVQPNDKVKVTIRLDDLNEEKEMKAVHLPDEGELEVIEEVNVEKIEENEEEHIEVSFDAEGFSIYAIIDEEEDDSIARARIYFEDPSGQPFFFLDNSGNNVDNQIIHTGSHLEEVGIPEIDADGQTFQGWFIYDKENNNWTSYRLNFGSNNTWTVDFADEKSITSNTATVTTHDITDSGTKFYARPYFGEVSYLTFYNQSDGEIILNRVQVIKGTTYDISIQKALPPDSIWNEQTHEYEPVSYVFAGWSRDSGTDDDDRPVITNTTVTVSGDDFFYPVFKQGHWVTFYSAPSGSGATYIPAKIVLSTQTSSVARPTTEPKWTGHSFVGWFTTPEVYDPTNENYYNQNGTINTAYNGYLSTNERASGAYTFNERLDEDLVLYAHWNAGTANVTVVKWLQVVTDDKNATTPTKEQMSADGYASNTSLKHYEYGGQQNLNETVNSILLSTDNEIVIPTGFERNASLSDTQVVVKDDGTAVLNLYFDRKLIKLNFDRDIPVYEEATGTSGTQYAYVDGQYYELTYSDGQWTYESSEQEYVATTSTSTNPQQYGLVDGEYIPLTRSGNYGNYTWTYGTGEYTQTYTQTYNNNGTQYGIVDGEYVLLSRFDSQWHYVVGTANNGASSYTAEYGVNYYRMNGQQERQIYYTNGAWRRSNSTYGELYTGDIYVRYSGNRYLLTETEITETYTDTRYVLQNKKIVYTGTRYTQGTTREFTGLYGQTLAQNGYEWPSSIGWQYQGYNKNNNGTWSGPSTYQMSYLGQFVVPANRFNGANVTVTEMTFSSHNATNTIYYYIQNADGTWPGAGEYIDAGVTTATSIQIAEKFDGFTMDAYEYNNNGNGAEYTAYNASWTSVSPNESSKTVSNGMAIRYRRLTYTVKFLDSRDGSELAPINEDIENVQVRYGSSMISAKPEDDITVASNSPQYIWDGKWYADEGCTTEFNFNETMPNHDVAVYAGWQEVWYWIKIEPDGGEISSTDATWFWEPYGGIVEEYHNVLRNYVEDPNGTYYYHYDEFDPETELNQYGTNERRAYYTTDASLSSDGKTYSLDPAVYSFVGWYKVKDDGSLEPYNFGDPVTSNLTIRALWRTVGKFNVAYSNLGVNPDGTPLYVLDEEGNPTESRVTTPDVPPTDSNQYADKSSSSIKDRVSPPTGYTFVGWYYNGNDASLVYNPGDSFIVDADVADENDTVWLYPVFLSIENQPVETTHIPFVGNGGTTEKTSGEDGDWTWEVNDQQTEINFVNVQPNMTFYLTDSAEYFTRDGYTFAGWGKRTEGETSTANNFIEYRDGKFYTKAGVEVIGIAADELLDYEELYALWEPKHYTVTVIKRVEGLEEDQTSPFAFTPSFTGMSGEEYQKNFSLTGKDTTVTVEEETVELKTTKVFEEIPYGTNFSITEGNYSDFETTVKYSVTDADNADENKENVSISNGQQLVVQGNVTVEFTNKRKGIDITLVKEDFDSNVIPGAKFKLTRYNGASFVSVREDTDEIIVGSKTIENIYSGLYELTELAAPDGYVILSNKIYFNLYVDGENSEIVLADEDGNESYIDYDEGEEITVPVTYENAETDGLALTVKNKPGVALPNTGGSGVTRFYVMGSLLVAGSLLAEYSLRRRERRLNK